MKKQIKSLIVSSVAALGFGAISVGMTFALFTSNAETSINVGSGKINVSSAASDLKLYSVVGTAVDQYTSTYRGDGVYTFTNGGTASLNATGSLLELDKITPGDRVTFTVTPNANDTNVKYKYRFTYAVDPQNKELAKGLTTKFTIGQEEHVYEGLMEYRSDWELKDPTDALSPFSFDIELPWQKGNEYQETSATIKFTLEAIQANAYTADEQLYIETVAETTNGTQFEPAQETAVQDEDLTIEATNDAEDVSVKVTIPAETEEVSAGNSVALVVSEAKVTTSTTTNTSVLDFDISLFVENEKVSSYSENIAVEINIGTGYHIAEVKHNGVALGENDFTYDPSEGIVRFSTNSFSPFSVEYYENVVHVTTFAELQEAAADPYTTIILNNDINVPLKTVKSGMAGAREVFEPETVAVANNVVIDGNEHTLVMPSFYVDDVTLNAIMTLNGAVIKLDGDDVTLKDLTIDCSHILNQKALINANFKDNLQIIDCTFFGDLDYIGAGQVLKNVTKDTYVSGVHVYDTMGFIYESDGNVLDGNVVIEDSLINTYLYTVNFGDGTENSSVRVKDSTIRGWTSYDGLHSVSFKNVEFKKTVYSNETSGTYNFMRAYSDVEFNGCVFDSDFSIEVINYAVGNFNNCSFAQGNPAELVDLTPASYEATYKDNITLKNSGYSEIHDGAKIIINGEVVAVLEVEAE